MLITAGLIHALPPSDRRCLDRKEAASYIGVSPSHLDKLVLAGTIPSPIEFLGRKVWDVRAIDRAVDALSGFDSSSPELDESEWDRLVQ